MEYIRNLIKGKSDSEKVAENTAEIERDIAERNQKRNRRLSEINYEIRSLNGIIQSLNTSYTTKLKPTLNLPKAPNTKIFISDALKKAVDDNRIEVVRREDERDRLNDEKRTLEAEIASATLVGWYRNPTGGQRAIAVPYDSAGQKRTLYPDFLFFHQTKSGIVVDLVDPHDPTRTDTAAKWIGLGEYAEKHGAAYRRIVGVISDGNGQFVNISLKDKHVRDALAANPSNINKVFDEYAGDY